MASIPKTLTPAQAKRIMDKEAKYVRDVMKDFAKDMDAEMFNLMLWDTPELKRKNDGEFRDTLKHYGSELRDAMKEYIKTRNAVQKAQAAHAAKKKGK